MAISERFDIRSVVAVGTLDFVSGRPSFYDNGFHFQLLADGNFETKVLATNFDPATAGNFVDITSLVSGGATITAGGWFSTGGVNYAAVRFNVTSLQSTKHLNVSGSWT